MAYIKRSQALSLLHSWSSGNVGGSNTLIIPHQAHESLALCAAHLSQRPRLELRGPRAALGTLGGLQLVAAVNLYPFGKFPGERAIWVVTMLSHSLLFCVVGEMWECVMLLPLVSPGLCCTSPRGHRAPHRFTEAWSFYLTAVWS